jgi:hypothetical protein
MDKLFFLILINWSFMKHNLIIYDITFVESYNINSIIDVFHGFGLKCHYFKNVLIILPLLC